MRWLFLFLFLCWQFSYSQEHPQGKTKQSAQVSKSDKQGSDKNPLSIKILPAPDADTKAEKDEKYREQKAQEDWWLTKSTIWLAFWTTILAVFTVLLWLATRKLVLDAKDGTERQLRAYVMYKTVDMITHGEIVDGQLIWRLSPIWVNNGETPTRNLILHTNFSYFSPEAPPPLPDFTNNIEPPTRAVLGKNGEINGGVINIGANLLNAIRDGQKTLFIAGVATYRDVFEKSHITQFYLRVVVTQGIDYNKVEKGETIGLLAEFQPDYNCADDKCEHTKKFDLPQRT